MNGQSQILAERSSATNKITILAAGDVVTLLLVTVIGFASHGELSTAGTRMLTTFFPLLAGWAAAAPVAGAYDTQRARNPRQALRPFGAMFLGAQLAAILRSIWLHTDVKPSFALVLGGVSAAGILIWRLLYALMARRADLDPKH